MKVKMIDDIVKPKGKRPVTSYVLQVKGLVELRCHGHLAYISY